MKKTLWIVTVLCAGGALALTLNARKEAETKSAPPVVRQSQQFIAAAGRVEPEGEEVKIGSELDGKLARVLVDEGDTVKRGQVVAQLVNGDFAARVQLAKATLQQREAQLERLRNGSRVEERREADARVREAQAQAATAKAERDRREGLLTRGAISRSEYDLAARDADTAQARVDALKERAALVLNETRVEDLKRAEAEVASAEASLREAESLLAKTYIRSPLDGRVLRRYRKTGESVSSDGSNPVLSLGDLHRLRVRVDVDEADVAKLHVGQKAWVTADAFGGRKFTGEVVRIGQILGRKNVRTDEPTERIDTKILETLVELDPGQTLPIGLRVDAFLEVRQ